MRIRAPKHAQQVEPQVFDRPKHGTRLRQPDRPRGPIVIAEKLPLPQIITQTIDAAALLPKSSAPEGKEPLLNKHERARLVALLPQNHDAALKVSALLEALPSNTARALVLRALQARLTRLIAGEDVLPELESFAKKLSGLDVATLRTRASVLDLDSRVNSNTVDPLERAARRGVIYPRGDNDAQSDNDGLFQRFTASCGPTVLQMMIAEADPILAFALHEADLNAEGPDAMAVAFQQAVLQHYAGIAMFSSDAQRWSRFRNALGRLSDDEAKPADIAALERYVQKKGRLSAGALAVAELLQEKFGFPTEQDLATLRERPIPKRDEGLGGEDLIDAITHHLSPLTGVYYRETKPAGGFARGQAYRHLDAVSQALAKGIDLPFGISEPSHWMLLTAVKGKKPSRNFLVSDPFSGRTAWVTEKDLKTGVFASKQFHLCTGKERGYVDTFFLPD